MLQPAQELVEELVLDRRQRHVFAVGAFIDVVEEGAAVEDIVAARRR